MSDWQFIPAVPLGASSGILVTVDHISWCFIVLENRDNNSVFEFSFNLLDLFRNGAQEGRRKEASKEGRRVDRGDLTPSMKYLGPVSFQCFQVKTHVCTDNSISLSSHVLSSF